MSIKFRYEVGGAFKRINTFSLFRKGIRPEWEDPKNQDGADFQLSLKLSDTDEVLSGISKTWEDIVFDVVTRQFPSMDLICGVRILDKSTVGRANLIRFEIWISSSQASDPRVGQIKDFINTKYSHHDNPFIFKPHNSRY